MIDFLLAVPGKLKSISDYLTTNWTTGRAAKLDYLTANVAVASTAVSNADYTSGRAAKMDAIIQTTVIQSIQTGYVGSMPSVSTGEDLGYVDVTITAVAATAKCVVIMHGGGGYTNSAAHVLLHPTGRLTSTTNLRVSYANNPGTPTINTFSARWTVVEFK